VPLVARNEIEWVSCAYEAAQAKAADTKPRCITRTVLESLNVGELKELVWTGSKDDGCIGDHNCGERP
jgi:hypothetical protein